MPRKRSKNIISIDIEEYKINRYLYEILAGYAAKFLYWKIVDEFRPEATWPLLHTMQFRAKSLHSLQERLNYTSLNEIKDLAGSRIIFHFKDDLNDLYKLKGNIKTWFGREAKETIHKTIDPLSQKFGYDSYHFNYTVIDGNDFYESLKARDQERLKGLKGEVQLRTILQHAWAESEHDLIYKRERKDLLPKLNKLEQKRKWAMHAAHIESLDEQFNDRKKYFPTPSSKKIGISTNSTKHKLIKIGYELSNINHPYMPLHQGTMDEIGIIPLWEMYNVDKEIVDGYKSLVWNEILNNNRQFIDFLQSYDTPLVRLIDFNNETKNLMVQPAVYTDQIVTNHTIAHEINIPMLNKKVRDLNYASGSLKSLVKSDFSNTIGVSCIIRTSDDYWVISKRMKKLAVDSNAYACPASGAVEWRERESWDKWDILDWFGQSIIIECEQELGISVKKNHLVYLGLFRELIRLGKPQIFFLIDMYNKDDGLSSKIVDSSWHIYSTDKEFEEIYFLRSVDLIKEIHKNSIDVTPELILNSSLALKYLGKIT